MTFGTESARGKDPSMATSRIPKKNRFFFPSVQASK